jgi:hypothetical protein
MKGRGDRFSRSSLPVATPTIMLIANAVVAAIVAVLTGLLSPQTCVTTTGMHFSNNGSGLPVLQYRTCSPSFDPAATFIVGLLVFVAVTVLELTLDARRILALRREQSVIWRADDEATMHLHNILVHTRQVASAAYGKHDRYLRYFMGEIVLLESKLREAAEQKDLVVSSDEFQSPQDIEGAFRQGSRERLFRYTWPIEAAGSVFTSTGWRYFFDLTIRMLAEDTLTGVRALLILSDANLLSSPNVQRLLTFYSTIAHAEARVVLKRDLVAIAERNEVRKDLVDFGIYDNSLLYVTEHANGRFSKDEFRIGLYLRLFDTIWTSAGVVIAGSQETPPDSSLSLSRLLELDRSVSQATSQTSDRNNS